ASNCATSRTQAPGRSQASSAASRITRPVLSSRELTRGRVPWRGSLSRGMIARWTQSTPSRHAGSSARVAGGPSIAGSAANAGAPPSPFACLCRSPGRAPTAFEMLACGRGSAVLTTQLFCFDSRPDKACHGPVGAGIGARAMIIENQKDVTTAVLSELQRAPDARFKEIMSTFVRHLHDFVRETKLTEEEFHAAIGYVIALGKHSNESHNEAVLMAGSLGLSALICLINN